MGEEETGILNSICGLYRQRQNAAETAQSKGIFEPDLTLFFHYFFARE